MNSPYLIKPNPGLREQYLDMMKDWEQSGEHLVPFVLRYDYDDFPALIRSVQEHEKGIGIREGFVPNSTFWLVDDSNRILGVTNLRHCLNERLLIIGGHIGYGIRPSERRKGYATKILELSLLVARKFGIDTALVTCERENIASKKTILNNGGIFWRENYYEGMNVEAYRVKTGLYG